MGDTTVLTYFEGQLVSRATLEDVSVVPGAAEAPWRMCRAVGLHSGHTCRHAQSDSASWNAGCNRPESRAA